MYKTIGSCQTKKCFCVSKQDQATKNCFTIQEKMFKGLKIYRGFQIIVIGLTKGSQCFKKSSRVRK